MPDSAHRTRLSEMERSAVKDEMRAVLIGLARERQMITYGELCRRLTTTTLHPHTFIFTRLLREVCGEELDKGSGMLCALVVSKATGMPSSGYFAGEMRDLGGPGALEAVWRADVESVFARWAGE